MADLRSATVLHVSSECLAVEEGEKEGEALLTFPRAVEVYNLHDNRCVHSWSLGGSQQLTCHPVFHRAMGVYCAVRNKDELLLWTSEESTLPLTHLTLPFTPLTILTPSLPHHLIAVELSGSVHMVSVEGGEVKVLGEEGRKLRGRKPRVVMSVMSEVGKRESAVVMCEGGEVFVYAVEESGLSLTSRIDLRTKIFQHSVCVCGEILLMKAEGGISALSLSSSSSYLVTPSYCHQLAAVSPSLFVATNEGGVVTLRDSLYGTCQEEVTSRLSHIKMLCSVWGHVVMCGEDGVRVCRVCSSDRVSLAAVLGRKTTPPPEAKAVSSKWAETQTGFCWRSQVGDLEERETLLKLCDRGQTPTLESVSELFPSSLSLPSPSYLPLVRRLVRETEFWPHFQLTELVKANAVTGSEAGEVVERALRQVDWALVVLTMDQSEGIPESSIVSLLHHALDLPESVEEQFTRESILWRVLALPFSDSLLQPPLSLLPLSSVLSLLQFLTPHISVASLCHAPPLPYSRLLDWLAVLLDTHWPALSLSPSAKHLIHNFQHTTYHQMLFCENLATVENMLEAGKKPRVCQAQDQYITVERVKIKI